MHYTRIELEINLTRIELRINSTRIEFGTNCALKELEINRILYCEQILSTSATTECRDHNSGIEYRNYICSIRMFYERLHSVLRSPFKNKCNSLRFLRNLTITSKGPLATTRCNSVWLKVTTTLYSQLNECILINQSFKY